MNIIIHETDGGFCDHPGLEDHLSAERVLARMGYEIFPEAAIPAGEYGDGRKLAVRHEDGEYDDGEYDVAEIDE